MKPLYVISLFFALMTGMFFFQEANADSSVNLVVPNDAVQMLTANHVSNKIVVQLQNSSGTIINAASNMTIHLSTSSHGGKFSTRSDFSSMTSSFVLRKGADSASFFYLDASAGIPTITISSNGFSNFTTSFVIMPDEPVIGLPSENSFVVTDKPIISGTAQPGSIVTLYDNNTKLGTMIGTTKSDNNTGAWSIVTSLTNDVYSVSATSTVGLLTGPVSLERNFTVDTTPPTLSITAPAYSAVVNTARSIVSGTTSSDKIPVKSVTWGIDGGLAKAASGVTNWSFRTGRLLDGPHIVQINATNSAGLATSKLTFVTVDNTPPTVSISQPENNAVLNHISMVNGTASDNVMVSYVSILVDGSAQSVATYSSGSWSAPMLIGLTNGKHTITSVAIDAAGNVNTNTISVTIDSTPPTVSMSYPPNNAIVNTASTITGTSSDLETGIASMSAMIDGGYRDVSGTTNWSITTSGLQGHHVVSVTATDEAGNTATTTSSFTVDATPPTISITTPDDNEILDTNMVTASGTASDDTSVSSVTWSVDGGPVETASGMADWSFSTKLSNGHHLMQVNATDAAGNTATATRVFTVDPTLVKLSITSPENNTGVNTDSIQVTGTASSSIAIPSITWSVDGGPAGTASGSTNWSFSTGMLSTGMHTIHVNAVNVGGNAASQKIIIMEDTHSPTLTISNPVDGTTLNHISSINGTASDDNGVSSVTVLIDGTDEENAIYSEGLWTVPVTLSAGGHSVSAVATDIAGNSVTSSEIHFLLMSAQTPLVVSNILTNNNTSNVPNSTVQPSDNGTQTGDLTNGNTKDGGVGSQNKNSHNDHSHDGDLGSQNKNQHNDSSHAGDSHSQRTTFHNNSHSKSNDSHSQNVFHLSSNSHSQSSNSQSDSHSNSDSHSKGSNSQSNSHSSNDSHSQSNTSHSSDSHSQSSSSQSNSHSSSNSHSQSSSSQSNSHSDSHSQSNNSHSDHGDSHSH